MCLQICEIIVCKNNSHYIVIVNFSIVAEPWVRQTAKSHRLHAKFVVHDSQVVETQTAFG